jgi:hypothetical protein
MLGHYKGDIVGSFSERAVQTIPPAFAKLEKPTVKHDLTTLPNPADFATAALLGGWTDTSADDRSVVEGLAGTTYASWIPRVREVLLTQPESPLVLKDGAWRVAQRAETWEAIGPRIFDEGLDKFKTIAVGVLSERDPKFDLPAADRFAASLYGKTLRHSELLRKGLAETLALLGSRGNRLTSCTFRKPEAIAAVAVREILSNADWVLWASLNDLLPLLAEASPQEFLDVVEKALGQNPSVFDTLFTRESGGVLTGWNYMGGVLSALETLAWDADHLTRIVVILGELASRDPGGNLGNRPANSLSKILLPWLPQTLASISKRKTAVEILSKESPAVAWKLVLDLLPSSHQISTGSRKPEWRSIIPLDFSDAVTTEEYLEQINAYAELAITLAKNDISKLVELIERANDLPPAAFNRLLTVLRSDAITLLSEEDRFPLWAALTDLLIKHRKFADAQWVMGPEILKEIEDVVGRLVPNSARLLHRRLFRTDDSDLYEFRGKYEEQRKELNGKRQKAVLEVLASDGIDGVSEFANTTQSPWDVGFAFGTVAETEHDEDILPTLLKSGTPSLEKFAAGFVWARFQTREWKWVDKIDTSKWSHAEIGQLLSYLPFNQNTWDRVARLLGENEAPYWSIVPVNPFDADKHIDRAVQQLLKYGRPDAAILCLEKLVEHHQDLNADQAVRVLKELLLSGKNLRATDIDAIIEVIQALQSHPSVSADDLFQIEWGYLPLLDRVRGSSPRTIELRLANDPSLFCEIIRLVFRSEAESEKSSSEEPSEQSKEMIRSAYRLLKNWRMPPGTQKDGTFDSKKFEFWLETVKAACTKTGHLKSATRQLGHVLVYAPPDPDGLWLHRSVSAALNDKDADEMRQGFTSELFNSRGVYTWTGGKEERTLATKYRDRADKIESAGFQRLATALRELANSYESDAERQARKDPLD